MARKKSIKIKDKIKYLAIGDDFSLGYTIFYDNQYPGYYRGKDDHKLGINFPSYLVNYFLENKEIEVEWYENYSFLGARAIDFLYFLNVEKDFSKSKNIIKFNQMKDQDFELSNIFWDNFNKKFDSRKKDKTYPDFNNLIKEANLITITLGFNDIFWDFPFEKILFNVFTNSKNDFDLFWKKFILKQETFKNKLFLLLKTLRQRNPEAAILYVIPPHFFSRLKKMLNIEYENQNINFLNSINNNITAIIKKVINDFPDIYFINTYDEKIFELYSKLYNRSPFDSHPTQNGYKKMAKDIFFKLSFKDNFSFEEAKQYKKNYTLKYYLEDFSNFRQVFDYKKSFAELFVNSNDEEIETILPFEKEFIPFEKKIGLRKILLLLISVNGKYLWKYFDLIFSYISEYNKNVAKDVEAFFKKNDNYIKLGKIILRSNIVEEILQDIQYDLDFYPFSVSVNGKDFLNLEILKKIVNKNFYKKETYFNFLNFLYRDNFAKENNDDLKNLFVDVFVTLIRDNNLAKFIYDKYIEKYVKIISINTNFTKISKLYNLIVTNSNLELLFKQISSLIFDHYLEFGKITKYDEFLANFAGKYAKTLVINIFSFINGILNDKKIQEEIRNLILNDFKYNVQEPNLLFEFWNILDNSMLEELIFKFLDYVSLELKYPPSGSFSKSNILKLYIKKNHRLFFRFLAEATNKIQNFKDIKFLMYYFSKNPLTKKYFVNLRTFNSELNSLSTYDFFRSRRLLYRITRPFSIALYSYCEEKNDFDTFKEAILLLLNVAIEIFEIIKLPKNKTFFKYAKKIVFSFLKTNSKQANTLIKNQLRKYDTFTSVIVAIDKLEIS